MRWGTLVFLTLLSTGVHGATKKGKDRYPAVTVRHVHFKRQIRFKPFDDRGRSRRGEARRLETLLRCHHTGRRHALNSKLVQLIYKVARHFPAQQVDVISGYRSPKIARRKGTLKSNHPRGRAVDIRVPGVSTEELRDYLRTLTGVGVGYYPRSQFVHLDVREGRSVYWIDRSGPGERADYVTESELAVEAEPVPEKTTSLVLPRIGPSL